MSVGIYINFADQSKEAISYYENIFKTKCTGMMFYKEMPSDPDFPIEDKMKDLVLNAALSIHETLFMFSDVGEGMHGEHIIGNNITLVVNIKDEAMLTREFNALAQEGQVKMPLMATFWSDKYGYVVDKFNIGWQFSLMKE